MCGVEALRIPGSGKDACIVIESKGIWILKMAVLCEAISVVAKAESIGDRGFDQL